MISGVQTSVSSLRAASRSFGGRVQSNEDAVTPLSRARATGDQEEALRDNAQDDSRDGTKATTTEEEFGDEAVRMRQAQSGYDGNRMMVDGEDRVLGTILNDRA